MADMNASEIGARIAEIALDIRAIKLSPDEPFTWASGYRMPIYNDNRMFLGNAEHRALIAQGLAQLVAEHRLAPEVIGGTVTAGISPGTSLADRLGLPFVYVRDKAKGHGLKNRVEGILKSGQRVVMVEDLISTGGSSIDAIVGVREGGAQCDACVSIFAYGFEEADNHFRSIDCKHFPLLTFSTLLEVAVRRKYLTNAQQEVLGEWRLDPFGWGIKRGFPKAEKK